MRFIKEHSYEIVRLFLNQIALAFFGLVLFFATGLASDGKVGVFSLVASIFSVLFYLYILYATVLEMGQKDSIKVESGSLKEDRLKGLKLILLAQVPNFLILFVMGLGWILAYLFRLATPGLYMYSFSVVVMQFLQAMYNGIVSFIIPSAAEQGSALLLFAAFCISTLPQILVCFGAYILGLKNKPLFGGHEPKTHFHS